MPMKREVRKNITSWDARPGMLFINKESLGSARGMMWLVVAAIPTPDAGVKITYMRINVRDGTCSWSDSTVPKRDEASQKYHDLTRVWEVLEP